MSAAEQTAHDFVVETKGHCFFCFNQILPANTNLKFESGEEEPSKSNTHSLHYLSRFLDMDLGKVFWVEGGPIPSHWVSKVRKSKLQVELCEECISLNNKFSKNYKELEKAEMVVVSMLELILARMTEVGGTEGFQRLHNLEALNIVKMQILKVLREDIMGKCSRRTRLSLLRPSVKLQELSRKPKIQKKFVKRNFKKNIKAESCSVDTPKVSQADESPDTDNNDGMDNDFDNQQPKLELAEKPKTDSGRGKQMKGLPKETIVSSTKFSSQKYYKPRVKRGTMKGKCVVDATTNQHTCTVCAKVFTGYGGFYYHYKSVHLKLTFTCNRCNMKFTDKRALLNHRHYQQHKCRSKRKHLVKKEKDEVVEPKLLPKISDLTGRTRNTGRAGGGFSKTKCTVVPSQKVPSQTYHHSGVKSEFMKDKCIVDPNTNKHKCRDCPRAFAGYAGFYHHYRCEHLKLTCNGCNATFAGKRHLVSHQNSKCRPKLNFADNKKGGEVDETKLLLTVPGPSGTDSHRKAASGFLKEKYTVDAKTNRHKCRDCSRKFASYRGFYCHYRIVHLKHRLKCQACKKKFITKKGLLRHQKIRCKPKREKEVVDIKDEAMVPKVPCVLRRKYFKICNIKKRYLAYSCKFCGKGFPGEHSFNRHVSTVHLKSEGEFKCDWCGGKKFDNKDELYTHQRLVHPGDLMKMTMSDLGLNLKRK